MFARGAPAQRYGDVITFGVDVVQARNAGHDLGAARGILDGECLVEIGCGVARCNVSSDDDLLVYLERRVAAQIVKVGQGHSDGCRRCRGGSRLVELAAPDNGGCSYGGRNA